MKKGDLFKVESVKYSTKKSRALSTKYTKKQKTKQNYTYTSANLNGDILPYIVFDIYISPSMYLCDSNLNLVYNEYKMPERYDVLNSKKIGIILNGFVNKHPNFKAIYNKHLKQGTLNADKNKTERFCLVMMDNKIGLIAYKYCKAI